MAAAAKAAKAAKATAAKVIPADCSRRSDHSLCNRRSESPAVDGFLARPGATCPQTCKLAQAHTPVTPESKKRNLGVKEAA